MTVFEFNAESLDGKPVNLDAYRGKVLLIVNTASECGFTPQYKGLEEVYQQFKDKGVEVLGFPCNQFGSQEPGNAEESSLEETSLDSGLRPVVSGIKFLTSQDK